VAQIADAKTDEGYAEPVQFDAVLSSLPAAVPWSECRC
jgi:hypothetical protein